MIIYAVHQLSISSPSSTFLSTTTQQLRVVNEHQLKRAQIEASKRMPNFCGTFNLPVTKVPDKNISRTKPEGNIYRRFVSRFNKAPSKKISVSRSGRLRPVSKSNNNITGRRVSGARTGRCKSKLNLDSLTSRNISKTARVKDLRNRNISAKMAKSAILKSEKGKSCLKSGRNQGTTGGKSFKKKCLFKNFEKSDSIGLPKQESQRSLSLPTSTPQATAKIISKRTLQSQHTPGKRRGKQTFPLQPQDSIDLPKHKSQTELSFPTSTLQTAARRNSNRKLQSPHTPGKCPELPLQPQDSIGLNILQSQRVNSKRKKGNTLPTSTSQVPTRRSSRRKPQPPHTPGKCSSKQILPLQPQVKSNEASTSIINERNNMITSPVPTVDFHALEYDDYALNEFFDIKVTFQDIFLQVLRPPFRNMPELIHEFHRITTKIRSVKDIIPRLKCISRTANAILDNSVANSKKVCRSEKLEYLRNLSENLKEKINVIRNSADLDLESKRDEIKKLEEEFLKKFPIGKSGQDILQDEAISYLFGPPFSSANQDTCCEDCVMKEIKSLCHIIFYQINGKRINKYLFAEFRSLLNNLNSLEGICPILKVILKAAEKLKSDHPGLKTFGKNNASSMKKDEEDFISKIKALKGELKEIKKLHESETKLNRKELEELKRQEKQREEERVNKMYLKQRKAAELKQLKRMQLIQESTLGLLENSRKEVQGTSGKPFKCLSCPKRQHKQEKKNRKEAFNVIEKRNLNTKTEKLKYFEKQTKYVEFQAENLAEQKKKLIEELEFLKSHRRDNVQEMIDFEKRTLKQRQKTEEEEKAREAFYAPMPELDPNYKPPEWIDCLNLPC